jgi:hypothetical protein
MVVKKKPSQPLKLGDRVQVLSYPALRGRIVELRGPLGPGGAQVYSVRIERKPKPSYIELTADLLEVIPAEG